MDFKSPMQIAIDYTKPFEEVELNNVSGGSAPLTAGPPPASASASSERPEAIYNELDIPISTCKAVRIGCWTSSPIDSNALNGKIYPNFLQKEWWPSQIPVPDGELNIPRSSPTSSKGTFLPIRVGKNCAILGESGEFFEFNAVSGHTIVKDPVKYDPSQDEDEDEDEESLDLTDRTWIVNDLKKDLKLYEIMFKSQFRYDTTAMEERYLYSPSHGTTISMKDKSSGIPWFGVYGLDDICVVTLTGHVDWTRVCGCLASTDPEKVLSIFRRCVLSELEDLADPSSKRREELNADFDTPFCVVSPGTAETLDESGLKTYPHEAVSFVQETSILRRAQDSGGAIKSAIFGFQRLVGKKCEAKDIEVTVLFGRNFGSGYTRDLDISEIGGYLAAVEPSMPDQKYVSEGLYPPEMYP